MIKTQDDQIINCKNELKVRLDLLTFRKVSTLLAKRNEPKVQLRKHVSQLEQFLSKKVKSLPEADLPQQEKDRKRLEYKSKMHAGAFNVQNHLNFKENGSQWTEDLV